MKTISPLRYPGGKARISDFMEDLILLNNQENCVLYEMYAGGAGASLNLLFSDMVAEIVLNDLDYHIYAFWYSILNRTDEFVNMINSVKVDVKTWNEQKKIYLEPEGYDILEVGFSSFFLNRSNRSGVFNAGPIGGKEQNGNYKIDVRFNKSNLIKRIELIASKRDRITVTNRESIEFLAEILQMDRDKNFIFLDPPYYVQGENLYFNFYEDKNHEELSTLLNLNNDKNWFLTYDNCDRIKELYLSNKKAYLPMSYTLQSKVKAKEVMVFSDSLSIPKQLRMGKTNTLLNILTA